MIRSMNVQLYHLVLHQNESVLTDGEVRRHRRAVDDFQEGGECRGSVYNAVDFPDLGVRQSQKQGCYALVEAYPVSGLSSEGVSQSAEEVERGVGTHGIK